MRPDDMSLRGGVLLKTPSARHLAARRRLMVVGAMAGVAFASALVGAAIHPGGDLPSRAATGPFSYFPSE